MSNRLFLFAAGDTGSWIISDVRAVRGESLATAARLAIHPGLAPDEHTHPAWCLRGITSNERYAERTEKEALLKVQPPLGRTAATRAALIPIRKTAAWWLLTQDERRQLFEAQSKHTEIGLRYLPAIARRLHHCRDLGEQEPFDFLTWFEFAPADEPAFDNLLAALRAAAEWAYVEREVEVRLTLAI
ncbi:MAG: chlorite dismutase family protein [Pseudomonadota bacterium]